MYWWQGPPYNFGDWIGPYLYRARVGSVPTYREPSNRSVTCTLVTVGSLARFIRADSLVWGSGILTRNSRVERPHETIAVRGPLTRQRFHELGYACPAVYGDPAVLMPLYCPAGDTAGPPIGIVPHYVNFREATELFGHLPGVSVIDVTGKVEDVVRSITSCEVVLSSSLHGLIIAHSFGLRAARVRFGNSIYGDDVKFDDYYQSLGPIEAPPAVQVTSALHEADLFAIAAATPIRDHSPLRGPLMDSCPF
jgi:pyruvyltransferase